LRLTVGLLSLEGQKTFIKTWKNFEYPTQWGKLPNPISHCESFMMSDNLRLSMVMPFILNRFLRTSHLKHNELIKIQQRIHANRVDLIPKSLIKCWVLVSKSMQLVFKNEYSENNYKDLQEILETESKILTQVIN
jgi:methyltransferase-like protein